MRRLFGNVERKKILLDEVRVLVIIKEGRALGVEESMKKVEIVSELERSTLTEEVSGGKNLGSCGLGRVTSARSFFT
jgi:hypothetical protein